jgi:hypothetical protein
MHFVAYDPAGFAGGNNQHTWTYTPDLSGPYAFEDVDDLLDLGDLALGYGGTE